MSNLRLFCIRKLEDDYYFRYIGIFEGPKPMIMIKDLELLKNVGIKDFDSFHGHRSFLTDDKSDVLTNNLFFMKGELLINLLKQS